MKNKNSNRKIRVIAILCASVLALSSAFAFAGCSGSKDAAPTTAAATVSKATEAKTQAAQDNNNDAQAEDNIDDQQGVSSQSQDDSSSGHSINEAWYAGISEQQAGFKALEAVGDGKITYTEQGTYNGQECWNIYIKDSNNIQYDVYVSGDFCYVESDTSGHGINDAYFAGISEQMAGLQAVEAAGGEGWKITSIFQSTYNGADAWQVVIENENGDSQTVFVNSDGVNF